MPLTTKIFKTCLIVFAGFLGFLTFRLLIYHYALITFPYPDMLREGAIMTTTQALVHGLNPYAMDLQPQYTNAYGILYPLLIWPLAKIFGTTMLLHRLVTAFFILASCGFMFLVMRRMKIALLLNIWACLMLYASLLYPGTSTPCVDPASMGVLLFLLTVFIPWLNGYSYKSLIISVICGILAFYTKQYTMLGIVIMGSYAFFFVSKIKGIFYTVLFLVLAAASVVLVDHLLPAYFDNCFFMSVNMAKAWSTMERLQMQVHLYSQLHKWVLLLLALFILGHLFKFLTDHPLEVLKKNRWQIPLHIYAGLWAILVLYKSLGRHNGATLWYFFQLLSPFLLITLVWLFNRHVFWPLVCAPLLIVNLFTLTADDHCQWFNKKMGGWPEITRVISQHTTILNISLIAPILIEQNKEVFDNGMSEYFGSGGARPAWIKKFVPEDHRVDYQLFLFFDKLRHMVEAKQFDLIIVQPGLLPMGVGDDIEKYYKFEGDLDLYAPQDRKFYGVSLWKPL